jgi:hypothetical protein
MAYAIASEDLHKLFILSDYKFNYNNFTKKIAVGVLQNLLSARCFLLYLPAVFG